MQFWIIILLVPRIFDTDCKIESQKNRDWVLNYCWFLTIQGTLQNRNPGGLVLRRTGCPSAIVRVDRPEGHVEDALDALWLPFGKEKIRHRPPSIVWWKQDELLRVHTPLPTWPHHVYMLMILPDLSDIFWCFRGNIPVTNTSIPLFTERWVQDWVRQNGFYGHVMEDDDDVSTSRQNRKETMIRRSEKNFHPSRLNTT